MVGESWGRRLGRNDLNVSIPVEQGMVMSEGCCLPGMYSMNSPSMMFGGIPQHLLGSGLDVQTGKREELRRCKGHCRGRIEGCLYERGNFSTRMCVWSGWLINQNKIVREKGEIGSIGQKATNVNKRRSPRQPPQRQYLTSSLQAVSRNSPQENYSVHHLYRSRFKVIIILHSISKHYLIT